MKQKIIIASAITIALLLAIFQKEISKLTLGNNGETIAQLNNSAGHVEISEEPIPTQPVAIQPPSIFLRPEYKYEVWQHQTPPSQPVNEGYSPVREPYLEWPAAYENYELEVSKENSFEQIVYKNQLPRTAHTLNFLNTGEYFVRVRGNTAGHLSPWSTTQVSIKNIAFKKTLTQKRTFAATPPPATPEPAFDETAQVKTTENTQEYTPEKNQEKPADVSQELQLEKMTTSVPKKRYWYASLTAGPKIQDFYQKSSALVTGTYASTSFTNLNLAAGYKFSKNHGAELFYGMSQQEISTAPGITANMNKISTASYGLLGNSSYKVFRRNLNLKYGYRLFEQPFLKAATSSSATLMNTQIGNVSLGIKYDVWNTKKINYFFGFDYDLPTNSKADIGTYDIDGFRYGPSLGLTYNFNDKMRLDSFLKYTTANYDYTYLDETNTQSTGENETKETSFLLMFTYDFSTGGFIPIKK